MKERKENSKDTSISYKNSLKLFIFKRSFNVMIMALIIFYIVKSPFFKALILSFLNSFNIKS